MNVLGRECVELLGEGDVLRPWREVIVRLSDDPTAAGPAKRFLSPAQDVGIDLEDADALNAPVAGWNTRSSIG